MLVSINIKLGYWIGKHLPINITHFTPITKEISTCRSKTLFKRLKNNIDTVTVKNYSTDHTVTSWFKTAHLEIFNILYFNWMKMKIPFHTTHMGYLDCITVYTTSLH